MELLLYHDDSNPLYDNYSFLVVGLHIHTTNSSIYIIIYILPPTAPLDYRGVQETLTFSASTTQHLTFPSFVPDTLVEQDEFYTLNLRFAEERNLSVQLLPDEARVVIVDDDGKNMASQGFI